MIQSVPAYWEMAATWWPSVEHRLEEVLADLRKRLGWSKETADTFALENQFACDWSSNGRIIYTLSHSMAALFALTSCPPIERMPHNAFAIKVPREFFPCARAVIDSSDTWIAVGKRDNAAVIMPVFDYDTTPGDVSFFVESAPGESLERIPKSHSRPEEVLLSRRFASNVIAYVLNRDRSDPGVERVLTSNGRSVFNIKPPRGVVIEREFRDSAKKLVASGSLAGVRRALAHVVRGHWRNQPVGHGRTETKLTWVRPHRRGDESLGSVISRVERIATERRFD